MESVKGKYVAPGGTVMRTEGARGYFITFEGHDGSGKTTQLRRLADWLTRAGHSVVTLRNPGSTALGDRIRSILLDSRSESALGQITPVTEMALMFADRAQSIAEVITPALAAGSIVLCDRYTDSSRPIKAAGASLAANASSPCTQPYATTSNPTSPYCCCRRSPNHLPGRAAEMLATSSPKAATKTASSARATCLHSRSEAYLNIAEREPQRVAIIGNKEGRDHSIEVIELLIRELSPDVFPNSALHDTITPARIVAGACSSLERLAAVRTAPS